MSARLYISDAPPPSFVKRSFVAYSGPPQHPMRWSATTCHCAQQADTAAVRRYANEIGSVGPCPNLRRDLPHLRRDLPHLRRDLPRLPGTCHICAGTCRPGEPDCTS
jgi:hypothetical protein